MSFKHYKIQRKAGCLFRGGACLRTSKKTADGRIWITYNTKPNFAYMSPVMTVFIPEKEILDSLRLENPPAKIFVDNDKQLYFATYTNEFVVMIKRGERFIRIH